MLESIGMCILVIILVCDMVYLLASTTDTFERYLIGFIMMLIIGTFSVMTKSIIKDNLTPPIEAQPKQEN